MRLFYQAILQLQPVKYMMNTVSWDATNGKHLIKTVKV